MHELENNPDFRRLLKSDERLVGKLHDYMIKSGPEKYLEKIGVTPDFFTMLEQDDDWSFVIKAHALIESLLSQSISDIISEPSLLSFFQRLDTSDPQRGKVAVLRKIGVFDKKIATCIQEWSMIRNLVVHNAEHVNFKLDEYYKSLDKNQRKSFHNKFIFDNDQLINSIDYKEADIVDRPRKIMTISFYGIYMITAAGTMWHVLRNHPDEYPDFYFSLSKEERSILHAYRLSRKGLIKDVLHHSGASLEEFKSMNIASILDAFEGQSKK